jgi:cyclopropane-fatty-acyl-phospholipid synthase
MLTATTDRPSPISSNDSSIIADVNLVGKCGAPLDERAIVFFQKPIGFSLALAFSIPAAHLPTERIGRKLHGYQQGNTQMKTSNTSQTVVHCYSVFDKFFPVCGMPDYTEGIYHNNPNTPYEEAQQNQFNYLLDQAQCTAGSRILDIGCGNGALLAAAQRRGARAKGITVSPEQVKLCRKRGLNVELLNYRDIDSSWWRQFDAIIANGSPEHYVQPSEAAAGKSDEIYQEFFEICRRLIDPQSPSGRLVNTTIHFVRKPQPENLLKKPSEFTRNSDSYHYAMLAHSFGGWYPTLGQFERCAQGTFELRSSVDGTYDYHLTSEHWLREIRKAIRSPRSLRIMIHLIPSMMRFPRQVLTMLRCMLMSESWNWQFRTPHPPTQLLRQTWDVCRQNEA